MTSCGCIVFCGDTSGTRWRYQLGKCLERRVGGLDDGPPEPASDWDRPQLGHVQGTVRTLFDYLGSTHYDSQGVWVNLTALASVRRCPRRSGSVQPIGCRCGCQGHVNWEHPRQIPPFEGFGAPAPAHALSSGLLKTQMVLSQSSSPMMMAGYLDGVSQRAMLSIRSSGIDTHPAVAPCPLLCRKIAPPLVTSA